MQTFDLKVRITEYISDHQPGFLEARFIDAYGKEHIIHDKVPIFTSDELDVKSVYPHPGTIQCIVLEEKINAKGNTIISISTETPWDIESTEELNHFDVLPHQLLETEEINVAQHRASAKLSSISNLK